jgi:hypothetical protein
MQDLILNNYEIFLKVHFVGFIIGLGAATSTDYLFFKFLKDLKISKAESKVLKMMSNLVWIGVFIFTFSGVGLFYGKWQELIYSDSFLAKITIVLIIIINGTILHYIISPHLTKLSFRKKHKKEEMHNLRLKAMLSGLTSLLSWYYTLFLALNKGYNLKYSVIMGLYIILLLLGYITMYIIHIKLEHIVKKINP